MARVATNGADAKYTKKLKTSDSVVISRTWQPAHTAPVQYNIPKFGTVRLVSPDLRGLAAAANSTATECFGDVYFDDASAACITAQHSSIAGNIASGFQATIEGCSARVNFAERYQMVPSSLTFPDPWDTANRCAQQVGAVQYTCLFPDDSIVQTDANGNSVVWSAAKDGGANAESVLVAVLSVVAFAVLLPHSKQTTSLAAASHICIKCATQLNKVQEVVLADVTFAGAWATLSLAATAGVSALLHPSLAVVFSPATVRLVSFGVFAVYLFNASFVLVSILTQQLRPMFRMAYESTLLCTVAFMLPYNVAPNFHALFQFCVGATIVFVAFRDAVFATSGNATGTVHVVATALVGAFLLLPLIIDCDAVPATTEVPVLCAIMVQIASAGASMGYN